MLTRLIEALRQDGASVDSESLADVLWLANAMGPAQGDSERGEEPAGTDSLWESHQERSSDVALSDPVVIPPTDLGTLQVGKGEDIKALLKPVANRSEAGETAALGVLPTLQDRPGFKRAVKPFLAQHRQASERLDESSTVKRLTDEGPQALEPVFLPGSRRSLRLSLIRERTGTNALWAQPLDELAGLFRSQGTFKQQREWSLAEAEPTTAGSSPSVVLTELDRHGRILGAPRKADKIKWWPSEILLIASDFTSAGWWNGAYLKLLRSLAAQQPVVLLHTLPERLWARSWTGMPDAWVSSAQPLVATRAMEVRVQLQGSPPVRDDARLAIPLIEFAPQTLKAWANSVMGGVERMPAILLDEREPEPQVLGPMREPADAKNLSMQFRMVSSPVARSLAQHMSVTAPLSFPVMRWVQQAMLPQSDTSHLAEFILGGLLEALPSSPDTPADEVTYDFVAGVRPMLQQGMPKVLGLDIQRHVGHYLEQMHSEQLDMRAVVETWSDEQIQDLSPWQQSFAAVSRAFLERIGLRPRSKIESAVIEESSAVTPPEPGSEPMEWFSVGDPQPSTPEDKTESPSVHDRVRKLREPVIDLQWSPFDEDRLAIRTASVIDVWRPAHELSGRTIRRHQSANQQQKPAMTLVWWAPGEAPDNNVNLSTVKTIVRRITEALTESLPGRIRVRRLLNPSLLQHRRSEAQALLVFQTEDYPEWVDNNHEKFTAIERFVKREDVISTCVLMGAQRAAHTGITSKFRIKERFNLKSKNSFEPHVWRELSGLVNDLRERIQRRFPYINEVARLTAVSWLSANQLGVADFDGASTRLVSLTVGGLKQSESIESHLLAVHPVRIPVTRLFTLPAAPQQSPSKRLAVPESKIFCIDAQGATYLKEGIALREVIPGTGFPREPVFSPSSTRWWIAGEGANLVAERGGHKLPLIDVPLLSGIGGRLEDALHALLHDQVLTGWVLDDTIFVITAAGFLHHGSIYDVLESEYKSRRPLDLEPLNLHGILRGAGVSADGSRFATVTASGRLDLWDTAGLKRLRSWQAMTAIAQIKHISVALSATGHRIAFANGKTLRVVEEPISTRNEDKWTRQVLWVDDRPRNNETGRRLFASQAIRCTLALSTAEALELLETRRFAAIISDMGRAEGLTEGYVLLKALRDRGNQTPYFIYAGSDLPEHHEQALKNGAQGSTNDVARLFLWVSEQVEKASPGFKH